MPRPYPEEKRLEWKERVRIQQESGQAISQWCREQQIDYDSFLYWRKRFGSVPPRTVDRSSFVELAESPDKTGIILECQKVQIHLAKNFDPLVLIKCLRALKGEAC